jgi:hypothetical protein
MTITITLPTFDSILAEQIRQHINAYHHVTCVTSYAENENVQLVINYDNTITQEKLIEIGIEAGILIGTYFPKERYYGEGDDLPF